MASPSIAEFLKRWPETRAAERAHKDQFLIELCDVLGVPRPEPKTDDPAKDLYVFERDALLSHADGQATIGKMDLYKAGCFILEAKQGSNEGAKNLGTAKRDTPQWNVAMNDAFGQAVRYARTLDDPPPFLVVCDIGYCFDLYASFDGTGTYRAFPNARTHRLYFRALESHLGTLKSLFEDPFSLDPSRRAAKVTREVADRLAKLARALEVAGHAPERVAKFLMRCIFTMFAEDVGLIPSGMFTDHIEKYWLPNPPSFVSGVRGLWKAMNTGGDWLSGKLLQFNGGLFADADALPLDAVQLTLLLDAAKCDWSDVEPAIFGTLLERALDPKERHKLGAHYTPRAYVERLVRPTVEEPLRAEWDVVRAQVRELVAKEDKPSLEAAKKLVTEFYTSLVHVRVLDPACGSGNFLYVTLDLFKRLEGEVVEQLNQLGKQRGFEYGVTPEQFLGIEVKAWAKEIAELVLWIGYLQWHFRTHGKTAKPKEPVLRDFHNIECRDAVLAYDKEELVTDEKGKPVSRWDGVTYKKSPVTGEDVPDDSARVPVYRYVNPRKAEWPKADFVVGNPPFMGKLKALSVLGEGYVEALRTAYSGEVPDSCDFVMYWWFKAAELTRHSRVRRFGFITTNSITQSFNRRVVSAALEGPQRLGLRFAIPDHPWVDSDDGAQVRIAMTVVDDRPGAGTLLRIRSEVPTERDERAVEFDEVRGAIHPDLRVGVDITVVGPLRSNSAVAGTGLILGNRGFVLTGAEASALIGAAPEARAVIFPLRNGKDLTDSPRGMQVIDTNGWELDSLRRDLPAVYQRLHDLVFPERQTNRDPRLRANWWLFRRSNEQIRGAIARLKRFIATSETARHRFFTFLDGGVRPEHKLVVIGTDDASILGVLSSKVHVCWALAAGGHLGVGNDPVYAKTACFEPFPFPSATDAQKSRIRSFGEQLDAHRKKQQAAHPDLTITGMYNVLEKLRSGEALTAKDKKIHDDGLVSVLKQIHDDLDAAVLDAYGWPRDIGDEEILEKLVALNAERAREEAGGLVRWLRPDFQNPEGTKPTQVAMPGTGEDTPGKVTAKEKAAWPKGLAAQISSVRTLVASGGDWGVEQVAKAFTRAQRADVDSILDSLAALGLVIAFEAKGKKRFRWAGRAA
jgi:hypothetical protein